MSGQWRDVHEAAEALGISAEAVRKRVQRGSMESKRDRDKLYVWMDDGPTQSRQASTPNRELVDELRDRLRFVEGQLEAEREAHKEARRIIAGLVQRVPELEPSDDTASRAPEGDPGPSEPEPTEDRGRRFWKRLFGRG